MSYTDDLNAYNADPLNRLTGAPEPSLLDQKRTRLFGTPAKAATAATAAIPESLAQPVGQQGYFPGMTQEQRADLMRRTAGTGTGATNAIDVAQSSLIQSAGKAYDTLGDGINGLTGMDLMNTEMDDGMSNSEVADKMAGVSTQYRGDMEHAMAGIGDSYAKGDYGTAFVNTVKELPNILADSAGSIAELAVGGGIVGATLKGVKTIASAQKAFDALDKAKLGMSAANRGAVSLAQSGTKAMASASVAGASMTQQTIEDFVDLHGRPPSAGEVTGMMLLNTATLALEPETMKLLIPKSLRNKVQPSMSKFRDAMQDLARYADEGVLKSLLTTTVKGIPDILKAAGSEGAQEWLQTWAGIIGTNVDLKDGNWLSQAYAATQMEDAQVEAELSAFIGTIAGGGMKTAIGAPAVAVNATVDVAKGLANTGVDIANHFGDKAAMKMYNEADRAEIEEQFKSEAKVVADTTAEMKTKAENIKASKTVEELTDQPDVLPILHEVLNEMETSVYEMEQNPEEFEAVKKKTRRAVLMIADKAARAHATSKSARIAEKIGKNSKAGAKGLFGTVKEAASIAAEELNNPLLKGISNTLTKISKESVAVSLQGLAKDAKAKVMGLESDTARGMLKIVFKEEFKDKDMLKAMSSLSLQDIRDMGDVIAKHNPEFADKVRALGDKVESGRVEIGLDSNKTTDKENASEAFKEMAGDDMQVTAENAAAVAMELRDVTNGKMLDIETVEMAERALAKVKAYKRTDKNMEGAMGDAVYAKAVKRVAAARNKLVKAPSRSLGEVLKTMRAGVRSQGFGAFLDDQANRANIVALLRETGLGSSIDFLEKAIPAVADMKDPDERQKAYDKVVEIYKSMGKAPAPTPTPANQDNSSTQSKPADQSSEKTAAETKPETAPEPVVEPEPETAKEPETESEAKPEETAKPDPKDTDANTGKDTDKDTDENTDEDIDEDVDVDEEVEAEPENKYGEVPDTEMMAQVIKIMAEDMTKLMEKGAELSRVVMHGMNIPMSNPAMVIKAAEIAKLDAEEVLEIIDQVLSDDSSTDVREFSDNMDLIEEPLTDEQADETYSRLYPTCRIPKK